MSRWYHHPVYLTPLQVTYLEKHPMHTWRKFTPFRRAIEAAYDEPNKTWQFDEIIAKILGKDKT